MSSGSFAYSLSAAAAYVLRSLMERPDLATAEEIAGGPDGPAEIDGRAAADGRRELGERKLAAEDADGRWRLTEAA